MRGKRTIALALSAIMVLSPLSACSQPPVDQEVEEEMTRGEVETNEGSFITAEYVDDGIYTVTITEDDLITDEEVAEEVDQIVTADQVEQAIPDEEMTRELYVHESGGEVEEVVSEEVVVEEDDAEKTADEADDEVTDETKNEEVVEDKAETEDEEAVDDQSKAKDEAWSLASVVIDDVSVVYNYVFVTREASESETDDQPDEEEAVTEDEDYVEPEIEVETFSAEVTDVWNNVCASNHEHRDHRV